MSAGPLIILVIMIAGVIAFSLTYKKEGFSSSPYMYEHRRVPFHPNYNLGYINDFYAPSNCMDTLFGGIKCYPWNWWQYWYE
jgi:hypothetical protein